MAPTLLLGIIVSCWIRPKVTSSSIISGTIFSGINFCSYNDALSFFRMSLSMLLLFVKLLPLLPLLHAVVESSPRTLGVVDVLSIVTADADAASASGVVVLLMVENTGVDNGIDVFAPTPEPSLPLATIGVGLVDVDVDDPMVKIGRLYSSCASERGPPLTGERERGRLER